MAGLISKFARGFSGSMADSLKQQVLAERKQKLMELSRGWQVEDREDAQAFQGQQADNRLAADRQTAAQKRQQELEDQAARREHDKAMVDYKAKRGGGRGQDPAKTRAADILNERRKAEGLDPLPFQEALQIANTSLTDPTNAIIDLMTTTLEAQAMNAIGPNTEGYVSPKQARQDAIETVNSIREAMFGGPDSGAGAASGVGAPAPDAPPMPGAELAPDGNWYIKRNGKWHRVDPAQ